MFSMQGNPAQPAVRTINAAKPVVVQFGAIASASPISKLRVTDDERREAERTSLAAHSRRIETEAAPIRYVAELVGADTDSERGTYQPRLAAYVQEPSDSGRH
jgi:hypothetical protein